jgi:hypothetical protein
MKRIITLTVLGVLAAGSSVMANTFSDADSFGGLNGSGNPLGITLNAAGPLAGRSKSGTFDFVVADGTSFFQTGTPYPLTDQDPYSTVLGFLVGTDTVVDGYVALFFRDPRGGSETLTYTSSLFSQLITSGAFTTQLHIQESINATVAGIIDASGNINYTITATTGSFILDGAYMEIYTKRPSVPDGGATAMLLGMGVLSLGAIRRKIS